MRNQDEVRLGETIKFGRLGWINVNGFTSSLDEYTGMHERRDLHVTGGSRKGLSLRHCGERGS